GLLLLREQVVGPLDGCPKRLLTGLGVPTPLEQVEALREALQDLDGRQDARARRRQLDPQRQVVETPAQLGDGLVGLESGTGAEELDRLRPGEGWDGVLDFSPDPKELPARHQELEVGTALEERREL